MCTSSQHEGCLWSAGAVLGRLFPICPRSSVCLGASYITNSVLVWELRLVRLEVNGATLTRTAPEYACCVAVDATFPELALDVSESHTSLAATVSAFWCSRLWRSILVFAEYTVDASVTVWVSRILFGWHDVCAGVPRTSQTSYSELHVPRADGTRDHGLVLETSCRVLASRDQAMAHRGVSHSGYMMRDMSSRSLLDQIIWGMILVCVIMRV